MRSEIWMIVAALAVLGFFFFNRMGKTSAADARALVKDGAQLVDVRTEAEFAQGHLPGALNIPVQVLDRRMRELGAKDKPLVLYCRSGARSGRAKRMLEQAGYTKVYDIGPMSAW
jgi:phage shock protein E